MVAQPPPALDFSNDLQRELIAHAQEDAPDEVCGILAGREQRVERVFRVRNTAEDIGPDRGVFRDRETGAAAAGHRRVHYYMDPSDQLRVYNEISDLDLDLIGYYHSHTHTEARPSPTDIRLAIDSSVFYVLVSLEDAAKPVVRAWRIVKSDPEAETGTAEEVAIVA